MASCMSWWIMFLASCVAVSAAAAARSTVLDDHASDMDVMTLFDAWNDMHGKHYGEEQIAEKLKRFSVFKDNLASIEAHNQAGSTYSLGLNEFADLSYEEFLASGHGCTIPPDTLASTSMPAQESHESRALISLKDTPQAFDWREHGAVTPVKSQGACGSCWAFASVASIEGIQAIVTGTLVNGSEQQLVSCVQPALETNCDGNYATRAFQWVVENGLASEEDYPYTSGGGDAGVCISPKPVSLQIQGYVSVARQNEEALLDVLLVQPVVVLVNTIDWPHYRRGIFDSGNCTTDPMKVNHAVLLVGYGTENGTDYWIVKNSWGTSWGESGYIRIARGTSLPNGVCSILSWPYAPFKDNTTMANSFLA